ncbi:MAG: UDP-N-acetylglucosamine--N-acetylmuramyl-(pentapeptide) pyrophosphoryl-undecaprenol N-acetylglucosamine transferase [Lentisphaerales bacterium]|nr:UDP-N-acetylglucosamine--N-acetylmuramyl-(pentapeptide) pyrophosphoryl-undecaprenol N-acetylglucosamine transferase [Lentisphaerales bacterium]
MNDFSIIISCGGTGGHFYPGLSIGREFQKNSAGVRLFVAGKHGPGQKEQAAKFDIPADTAKAIQFPTNKLMLPIFAIVFSWTTLKAVFYLMKHKPKAVLVMGSFASVPLGMAAVITGTPLFLHEGNTVIGKTNRLLSKWAKKLFLSFPAINQKLIHCPMDLTGMPIRPELIQSSKEPDSKKLKESLGFKGDDPLLLVFGGSQGAQRINENFYEALSLISDKFQFYHLSGKEDNSEFEKTAKEAGFQAKIAKSTDNMAEALQAADLIICRAGASSLAELAWFSKAALFIPLKIASENHQYHNARLAELKSAGEILQEDDLNPQILADVLKAWLDDSSKWLEKSKNMSSLAREDVSQTIIKSIVSSC